MADLKIYNNGENKILMSAGDRIIRQPYEFGMAFQNRMGLGNYIQVTGLSFYSNYSYLQWCDYTFTTWVVRSFFTIYENTNFYSVNSFINNKVSVSYNTRANAGSNLGVNTITTGINLVYTYIDTLDSILFLNNLKSTYAGEFAINKQIDKITIGLYDNVSSNAVNKYSRITVFNRKLADTEYRFYYNNKIGSALQSTYGIELDIHCNFAEILDFSDLQDGSDMRVGVRDYSGNNHHGEIMNLPAGELIEQLDFANANLFVPFIS